MEKGNAPWESTDDSAWNPNGIYTDKFHAQAPKHEEEPTTEQIAATEVKERILQRRASAAAALMDPDSFMVVRLMEIDTPTADIAKRLSMTVAEVERIQLEAEQIASLHLLGYVPDIIQALSCLANNGHQTSCPNCGFFSPEDHKFCVQCGKANSEYSARTFALMWGNTHEEEVRGECMDGHPTAIINRCDGYCNLCGVEIAPLLPPLEEGEEE